METVREMREGGLDAYFTMDAGPQVKVLCQQDDMSKVAAKLQALPPVLRVLQASAGAGVRILEGSIPWK
jgi:diphosphomevalonate decarboxylase